MRHFAFSAISCAILLTLASLAGAQPPPVLVNDLGVREYTVGQGAMSHAIGLTGVEHGVSIDTGKVAYSLRYVACKDPKDPEGAIPVEGYIGMPGPSACNWYHGGFFDLLINGQSVGRSRIRSLTVRSNGPRGYADFVFQTPMALVRFRFLGLSGDEGLYCQTLIEPRQEIKSVRLVTRCYPSAFVSNSERHILTPKRDLRQGEHADLAADEGWLMYYDKFFDCGYASPTATGVGPCAALWPTSQADKAGFSVGGYGIDTTYDLKPVLRDFRFIFFDFAGNKNADVEATLRARGAQWLGGLATMDFTDPTVTNWPLPEKIAEAQKLLATVPENKQAQADYAQWAKELADKLQRIQAHGEDRIEAEAEATAIISAWERGLPALRLEALLRDI